MHYLAIIYLFQYKYENSKLIIKYAELFFISPFAGSRLYFGYCLAHELYASPTPTQSTISTWNRQRIKATIDSHKYIIEYKDKIKSTCSEVHEEKKSPTRMPMEELSANRS